MTPERCDGCGRALGRPQRLILDAPLGRCVVRVHRWRQCAEAAREARGGGRFRKDWPVKEDKLEEDL